MGTFIANMIVLLTVVFASASAFSHRETVPLSQSLTASNCPEKWLDASLVDMGCLYFNTTNFLTWEEGNAICKMTPNSSLVDISTEVQMDFLRLQLYDNAEGSAWWTAGTDIGIEGQWIWTTTLTAVEDFVWESGFPSTSLSLNCLSLTHTHGYLGYDAPCDNPRYPICQLK